MLCAVLAWADWSSGKGHCPCHEPSSHCALCWAAFLMPVLFANGCSGAFMLMNTGPEVVVSSHGLLTTVGYKLGPQAETNYALEGKEA